METAWYAYIIVPLSSKYKPVLLDIDEPSDPSKLLGAAFMRDRENGTERPYGGFQADEMGFGSR